jgi:hypothetical protein
MTVFDSKLLDDEVKTAEASPPGQEPGPRAADGDEPATPPTPSSAEEVEQRIREEQDRIAREEKKIAGNEDKVVASHVSIGRALAELRKLAKKDWAVRLKRLDISPRVASRYIKLGESELARIGLLESDLPGKLPPDLMKLEWLCKLTADQLRDLQGRLDLKKANRHKVIEAVKGVLNLPSKPKAAPGLGKAVASALKRLCDAVGRIDAEVEDPADRQHIREQVLRGLHEVEKNLGNVAVLAPAGADGACV